MSDTERLLSWMRELQSVAQAGLMYSRDPYDRERFERVQHVAAEILAHSCAEPLDESAHFGSLHVRRRVEAWPRPPRP